MQSSTNIVHDPFASAEQAHGSANPTSFIVPEGHAKLSLQHDRFDKATTRDGEEVETLIGRQRDNTWTSLWLFLNKDGSDSRLREQLNEIRPGLTRGDVLVFEWQPLRESYTTPGRKVRPVTLSHFPASWEDGDRARATNGEAATEGPATVSQVVNAPLEESADDEAAEDEPVGESGDVPF